MEGGVTRDAIICNVEECKATAEYRDSSKAVVSMAYMSKNM